MLTVRIGVICEIRLSDVCGDLFHVLIAADIACVSLRECR
jgi:hypothetical protein